MDLVPVVSIDNPGATSLADLDRACRDHGFFLFDGHGLDLIIAETFEASKRFFDSSTLRTFREGCHPPRCCQSPWLQRT